jgi:drug/metabolite transporter (DMT)-like permease
MSTSTMTFRRYLILAVITLTAACGDTCLSIGMKRVGPVSVAHLGTLIAAVKTPWVDVGIVLLLCFFGSYLTALSWADLTFVQPATAFGYVILAMLSRFWLHEHVSISRWAGVLVITAGVGFVTRGHSFTEIPKTPSPQMEEA